MATLRDPLFRQTSVTAADLDNLRASGMGNLRKGFESGLMGNDITGMAADEASLRAANDPVQADALRQRIGALQQRQAAYAPEVQDVTKVGGVGDALSWGAGAVGQGVASMMDPMAASVGLNAAGGLLSMAPNPLVKAAGTGLRFLAPAAAYGINARHLKGEVYNDMVNDPTIMANHSAQELNSKANMYGGIAGLADTAFPAVVGRQFTGAGFGKGLLKHGGARMLGELGMEGATEAAQGYGSASLRDSLNPNVQHNDINERINDFAGGAAGAGPFAVAGHVADTGFRRTGAGVDVVSEKAGQVKDLLDESGAVSAVKGAASTAGGFVKGLFGKGKDKVIDTMADENGKITPDSVKQTFRDATNGLKKEEGIPTEDQSVLRGDVPDHLRDNLDSPEFEAWATKGHEDRTNKVYDYLERMAQSGDKTAEGLFAKVNDASTVPEHTAAVNEASKYILDNNELAREMSNAEAFGKLAGMGGKAVGKGAVAAGKLAASFGKSVWDGMKEGAKKNMQGSLEGFDDHEGERQSKLGGNYIKQQADMKKSRDRAELMGEYLAAVAQAEKPRYSAHKTGAESVPAYMKSIGFEIGDIADSWDMQNLAKLNEANSAASKKASEGKGTNSTPVGPASLLSKEGDSRGQQFSGLKLNLNRIVNSMRVMLGQDKAAEALTQLQGMYQGDTRIAPLFDFMHEELATQASPQGREHTAQIRDEAAQAVLDTLPQEKELALMKEGISMRTPEGRKELLNMVEMISANRAPREARVALTRLIGQKTMSDMLGVVNANLKEPSLSEKTVDDRGQTENYDGDYAMDENGDFVATQSSNDFEKNNATRLVAKGSGPKIYGYDYGSGMRHSTGKTDPFAPSKRVSKKDLDAWQKENADRASVGQELLPDPRQLDSGRPNLFVRGRMLADGKTAAVDKKINDLGKLLGVDRTPENAVKILREEKNEKAAHQLETLIEKAAKGDEAAQQRIEDNLDDFYETRAGSWDFKAKPAHEVMKDHNYSVGQKLAAFRDYLYADKEPVKARIVGDMLLDMVDIQKKGQPSPQNQTRTSPGDRKRVMAAMDKYFKDRDVVVGEQLSNRDDTQITAPELMEMAVQGRKVIDLARKPENKDDAAGMIDRANILTFKSKLSTSNDGLLHIPAGALVHWVKKQNGLTKASSLEDQSAHGNVDVNDAYLGAVLQGVWQIASSGMAEGLPYKLNGRGEKESFEKGVPPSLRLATAKAEHAKPKRWAGETDATGEYSDIGVFTLAHKDYDAQLTAHGGDKKATYNAMRATVESEMAALKEEKGTRGYALALKRAARKAKLDLNSEEGHIAVAIDQTKGEDPFVVDDTPAESEHMSGKVSLKGEGQFNADRFNPHYAEASDNTTPLDSFGKLPDGAQRDDFADVLGRTKESGQSVYSMRKADLGIEHATDAMEKAETRSDAIVTKLIDNPSEGLSDIASRLRTALRPSFVEAAQSADPKQYAKNIEEAKKQPIGGKQYLYPAAYALSPENIKAVLSAADVGPEEATALKGQLFGLRKAAAGIAAQSDMTPRQKITIAKVLATAEQRDKINTANVMQYLTKLGENGTDVDPADKRGMPALPDKPVMYVQERKGKPRDLAPVRGRGGKGGNVSQGPLFDGGAAAPLGKPRGALNAQDGKGNGMPSTEAQRQEARAYVEKVLGKEVRVAFEEAMGHSGEWVDVDNLIKISTTAAAGQLETAYHEALHAFFSKYVKNNPQVFGVLQTLADNEALVARVHALLDGHPAAQAQLAHGEERLAYVYQFWAAGKLDLPSAKASNWFQKLRNLFKRVLGMVSDSERAVALFEAFHEGKLSDPSAAGQVIAKELAKGTWTKAQMRKMDGLVQWVAGKTLASEEILAKSVSKRAQALARELYTNPADEKGANEEGYLNAKARHAKQYSNLFKDVIHDLSDRDMQDVETHMQKQTELADIAYLPVRKAVMDIRKLNQRFYRYMTEERGMKLGNLGPKYYPRVWSKSALIQKPHEFVKMLKDNYMGVLLEGVAASNGKMTEDEVAMRIYDGVLNAGEFMNQRGPQREDGVLAPHFMSSRVRDLAWLSPEHSEPFQEKNLVKTMTSYYHDGARAAEYTSRFGQQGEMLDSAMREIENELNDHSLSLHTKRAAFKDEAERAKWVKRQMRDVRDAVAAQEGTIGKNVSPRWRKINSWMVAYQNIRLLPLMLFSSMVDPMAMVGRGAPMKEAYDAYLRGMGEVFRNWADMFRDQPKERQKDKWEKLAEASGIVDAALFTTHVSDEYASVYMDGKAKKMNDMLFKLNGMEAWDRGMRVAATQSAALFIARHKSLPDKTHSARWLTELGLTPADIHLDAQGGLITDKNELMDTLGITKEDAERQADKMNYALSRWVQGAVLSPNAAHRPAWGSDPHYSMFFHLKQFTYSFHQTVLKRAVNELNYGNLAPLGTFAWYIPVMIASDVTKGLIQGGGELPSHMKGMDFGAWVMHGAERAGMLGLGSIGVDAARDVSSLGGPAVEQIIDAFGAPARNTAINAAPLHGLFAEALK